MDRPLRVAAVAGSVRRDALNRKLLDRAVEAAERLPGVETDTIDLRRHKLPLYDADLQERDGIPMAATAIHDRLVTCDAVLFANPEYNGGYPPLFKNWIDWVSRIDMFFLHPRYVGLLSTTPGKSGGVRGIEQVRGLMENIFVTVHPEAFALPHGREAFTEEGWVDEGTRLAEWTEGFVTAARAHAEARAEEGG